MVPCEHTFEAIYFCFPRKFVFDTANQVTNNMRQSLIQDTCDDGWVLLAGFRKCYFVLKPSHKLSFDEGVNECSKLNSSLISISASPRPPTPDQIQYQIKDMFQDMYKM